MTSPNSRQQSHHPRRQLDTSLERQARLAAANAVASCFPSPLRRQRSASLNTHVDQTRWLLVMPTFEVMYLFRFLFSLSLSSLIIDRFKIVFFCLLCL